MKGYAEYQDGTLRLICRSCKKRSKPFRPMKVNQKTIQPHGLGWRGLDDGTFICAECDHQAEELLR